MKQFEKSGKLMKDILPKKADWVRAKVTSFDPDNNKVTTDAGDDITYEYLVVAMGIQLHYEQVCKGL